MLRRRRGPTTFRPGDSVVASRDLPRVPVGTRGVVMVVQGVSWTRYRVHFDNGVELGLVDESSLERTGGKSSGARRS